MRSAATDRFSQHLFATGSALRQSGAGLLWRTARAIELWRGLQIRSGKPDPLSADVMHVREDRRNRTDIAGWLSSPCGRIKMLDKKLVQAVVGGKDFCRGPAKFGVNLILTDAAFTRCHGYLPFELMVLPDRELRTLELREG